MQKREYEYHFIYKTTNLKNKRYYVGMHSTNDLNDGYLGSGTILKKSFRKYGRKNFKVEILEFCNDRVYMAKREREIVNETFLEDKMCMNLMIGGDGGYAWKNKEQHMKISLTGARRRLWLLRNNSEFKKRYSEKCSESNIEQYKNGTRKNTLPIWTGKKHKEESKIKIGKANSIKQKGAMNSQFNTMWITNGSENKKIKKDFPIPEGWYNGRKN
jgi:hypothetical protein